MVIKIRRGMGTEEIKKLLDTIRPKRKGFDAYKYCGAIKFKEDAVKIQRKLRSEWD